MNGFLIDANLPLARNLPTQLRVVESRALLPGEAKALRFHRWRELAANSGQLLDQRRDDRNTPRLLGRKQNTQRTRDPNTKSPRTCSCSAIVEHAH